MKDSRFPPIDIKEVPELTVAVSLLVNFEKNKKALEWSVGKHGIIIEF
jgi:AMMECR1 domain-containing protein